MRRSCIAFLVGAALTLPTSLTLAQEAGKQLGADEIRSQILGHKFDGTFASEDEKQVNGLAYFGTDGKYLLQIDLGREASAIILGTLELKDDQICVRQTGAMRDSIANRCFKAYGAAKDGFWSGGLTDVEDTRRGIPLDWQHDLTPGELDSLWTNWDGIQKEAGPIDFFGSIEEIRINPFRFKGKVVLVTGTFNQMIGDGRARFKDNNHKDLIVEGVPNDQFQDDDHTTILIGEFTGSFRMTIEGSDTFVPVMSVKAARICKDRSCRDYFYRWQ